MEASHHTRPASPSALPACEPPAFQLAVINSCLRNEDIRLPQRPTPALLARFYHECDAMVTAAAAAGASTPSPWGAEYWRTRVPHVPLGRHSALPAAYQLRHECVGRLQARVIYVHASGVHRQLRRAYPAIDVTRTTTTAECRVAHTEDEVADEVVIVEPPAVRRTTTAASPLPPFTTSYYLLVNHGANPVFVGADSVPQGRSVVLCDGDVVSFLECAFDEDGGVLDAVECDSACARSPEGDAAELGATAAAALLESVTELANASLLRCVGRNAGASPAALTDVRVSHGLVGTRRLYAVPHVIRDYMQWWLQQGQEQERDGLSPKGAVAGPPSLPAPPSTAPAATAWRVAGNHLVRAPSIASDTGYSAAAPSPAPATPARDASRKRSRSPSSTPLQPAAVDALRHWLKATEEVEEVAEQAPSPITAQLLLDRAWLWQLLRENRHASTSAPVAVKKASASPPLSKVEGSTTADGVPLAAVKFEGKDAVDSTAERFRVSPQLGIGDSGGGGGGGGGVTPARAGSVVQSVLEELRRSRSGALVTPPLQPAGDTAEAVAESSVRRSLRLDVDPIAVCGDEAAEGSAHWPQRHPERGPLPPLRSPPRAPATAAAGVPTCVPGVRVRPAALPVYIFTARRGRSPDVHTRERTTLALSSPASPAAAGTGAVKQFVYYYEEPDEGRVAASGGEGKRRQPHAQVDAPVAAALLWVDETEEASDAVARGRQQQQQQRRRPHRKAAGAAHSKRHAAAPPRTPSPAVSGADTANATTASTRRRPSRPRKHAPR